MLQLTYVWTVVCPMLGMVMLGWVGLGFMKWTGSHNEHFAGTPYL